jgi:hypothetical protein
MCESTLSAMMNMELISTVGLARSNGWNKIKFKGLLHEMNFGSLVIFAFGWILKHYPFKRRMKSHLPFANIIRRFNVYGSVHRKYMQQDATSHSLFISGNCSTCFGWYFHPSSGAHTTVSTASGICHTVTDICRYRGRVGTGLSVLRVAYATHSTLKPVPTLPR